MIENDSYVNNVNNKTTFNEKVDNLLLVNYSITPFKDFYFDITLTLYFVVSFFRVYHLFSLNSKFLIISHYFSVFRQRVYAKGICNVYVKGICGCVYLQHCFGIYLLYNYAIEL